MENNSLKPETKQSIEKALSITDLMLIPLEGGTNNRTFFTKTPQSELVVRIEQGNGMQLRRAYNAQMRAKGLGLPVAHIVAHNFNEPEIQDWIVEEKVSGVAFFPDTMNNEEARKTSRDLGRYIKKLHAVQIDKFGLLPPFPYKDYKDWEEKNPKEFEEETERNGPPQNSFSERIDFYAKNIERAFEISGLDLKYLSHVKNVYERLKKLYSGSPILSVGDMATTNLIVKEGKVAAIIDLEWAQGGDPAENIAYWHYWNKDPKYLDYFFEGYKPDNKKELRERIDLYQVVTAIHLTGIFKEMENEKWIKGTKDKLEAILKDKMEKF